MDKALFEKYISEMRAMQAAAMPQSQTNETQSLPESEENSENMSGSGYLIVNVTSVRGLYPVENAKVSVFTGDAKDMKLIAELLTDESGKTEALALPAPSAAFSEAPSPSERPFAYYNIKTVADGFNEAFNYNVAVFDRVTSLQNVSLFPIVSAPDGNRPIIINGFEEYEL